jgi:hypothetical protein
MRFEPWCVPHPQFHRPEFLKWHLNRPLVKSYEADQKCTDAQRAAAQRRLAASDAQLQCGVYYCDEKHSIGEISLVPNGTYVWDRCGWMTTPDTFVRPIPADRTVYDVMLLLNSAEGGTFQHFMDGVAPKLAMLKLFAGAPELASLRAANRSLVVAIDGNKWKYIRDVFELFGLPRDVPMVFGVKAAKLTARTMVNACLAPPLNPTLWQLVRQTLFANRPAPRRDLIVYATRSDGSAGNGGRAVLNERSLLVRLRALVNATQDTDAPMTLDVFKSRQFSSFSALIDYFRRVLVIMGPHGGALTNVFFMQAHSHVIEFFPRNPATNDAVFPHGCNMFWLMSSMLELRYHQIVTTDVQSMSWNMNVDEDAVTSLVGKILGDRDEN